MHYSLSGEGPVDDLEGMAAVIARLLRKEGLDRISDLEISFNGWRGNARCQIVDRSGWIQSVRIARAPLSEMAEGWEPELPETLTIRDRPDDIEWSPIGVMMGRDD